MNPQFDALPVGLALLGLCACAELPARSGAQQAYTESSGPRHLVQGVFGVMEFNDATQGSSDPPGIEVDSSDLSLPVLGGVFQQALRGDSLQLGVEGGFTFGFRGTHSTVLLPNSIVIVADNDVLLSDLFGGLYLNKYIGKSLRLYGGAGPLLQYGRVDVEYIDKFGVPQGVKGSGWGVGLYARAGLEVELGRGTYVGVGVRWIDSHVNMSGPLEDLDYEAVQYMVTVSRSY